VPFLRKWLCVRSMEISMHLEIARSANLRKA
jgi:hypothetical protein